MKRIFSFLTIGLLATTWGQAQIPLRGTITVHNSKEKTGKMEYVSGAQVECPAAQPNISDINGRFVLTVSNMQMGNRVSVYVFPPECYKGYVVVNEKSLKETVLGTDYIWVSICPAGELDRRKAEILGINMDNYVEKKQYRQLKKQLKDEQEKVQRYSDQWNAIRDSLRLIEEDEDRMLKELENYADQLVRINFDLFDESNPLDISRRKAYQCAQRGELDSVMIYMQDRSELLEEALSEREKTRNKREAAQKVVNAAEQHIKKFTEELVFLARTAKAQYRHTDAEKYYRHAIQADSLNYELAFEFAGYLQEIREYNWAESYYQYCLSHYEQLTHENPKVYLPVLTNVLNHLGVNYYYQNKYARAEEYYLQTLKMLEQLSQEQPENSPLAINCRDGNKLLSQYEEKINYKSAFSSNCGSLAYYYLFAREHILSEQTAHQALTLDSSQIWIKIILAHALLFQNRVEEAETVYRELSQTVYQNNETYTPAILKDFDTLEKVGIIPEECREDMKRIRKQLTINNLEI